MGIMKVGLGIGTILVFRGTGSRRVSPGLEQERVVPAGWGWAAAPVSVPAGSQGLLAPRLGRLPPEPA